MADEDPSSRPFKTGDLVELKSGGFHMMVERVERRCGDGGWTVDVLFAGMRTGDEISRDNIPADCLQLVRNVDGKPRRPMLTMFDNIPF